MSIVYTNQPIRLKITATLEFEDGQTFEFKKETADFTEDGDTVASYFDSVNTEVYDKLEEFSMETEDDDEEWEDTIDYDPIFDGLEERDVVC